MNEKKRLDFSREFVTLGVQIDLSRSEEKIVIVTNKPGRLQNIKDLADSILSRGTLGFKESLSLKGKVAYAEGQLFSRVAAPLCRLLSRWASCGAERRISIELIEAIGEGCGSLVRAGPKIIKPISDEPPVLIFTDGACEEDCTSVGGVIFVPGERPEVFGAKINQETCVSWASKVGQKQVIGQAELFPILVARHTWKGKIQGKRVIYFIDNDSARLGLIKAYSPILPSLSIIVKCFSWDNENGSVAWYARVPTASNIADDPSRMDASLLVNRYGARIVKPEFFGSPAFSDIL